MMSDTLTASLEVPTDADDTCPLCWKPLGSEKLFHLDCARRENAEGGDDE